MSKEYYGILVQAYGIRWKLDELEKIIGYGSDKSQTKWRRFRSKTSFPRAFVYLKENSYVFPEHVQRVKSFLGKVSPKVLRCKAVKLSRQQIESLVQSSSYQPHLGLAA